jgi:hypothetical protein
MAHDEAADDEENIHPRPANWDVAHKVAAPIKGNNLHSMAEGDKDCGQRPEILKRPELFAFTFGHSRALFSFSVRSPDQGLPTEVLLSRKVGRLQINNSSGDFGALAVLDGAEFREKEFLCRTSSLRILLGQGAGRRGSWRAEKMRSFPSGLNWHPLRG